MWQQMSFDRIKKVLLSDPLVKEVVLLGSLAEEAIIDQWSDLDVGIVVDEETRSHFYPSMDWVKAFGGVYAVNQSANAWKSTSRVIFGDGSRVDFSIATDREHLVSQAPNPDAGEQVATLKALTNDFKFEAFLATSKIARNDLLIGLHLVLELERKCLVLAMMLRDREAGTTHHRHGGPYNEVVEEFATLGTSRLQLLERIIEAAYLFGRFAQQLDTDWPYNWRPLEDHVKAARRAIREAG